MRQEWAGCGLLPLCIVAVPFFYFYLLSWKEDIVFVRIVHGHFPGPFQGLTPTTGSDGLNFFYVRLIPFHSVRSTCGISFVVF